MAGDLVLPTKDLAIIADTTPLAPPSFDLSSHKVLWESIAREVRQRDFVYQAEAAFGDR